MTRKHASIPQRRTVLPRIYVDDANHQAALLLAKHIKRHLTDETGIIERQVEQINNDDDTWKLCYLWEKRWRLIRHWKRIQTLFSVNRSTDWSQVYVEAFWQWKSVTRLNCWLFWTSSWLPWTSSWLPWTTLVKDQLRRCLAPSQNTTKRTSVSRDRLVEKLVQPPLVESTRNLTIPWNTFT